MTTLAENLVQKHVLGYFNVIDLESYSTEDALEIRNRMSYFIQENKVLNIKKDTELDFPAEGKHIAEIYTSDTKNTKMLVELSSIDDSEEYDHKVKLLGIETTIRTNLQELHQIKQLLNYSFNIN